MQMCIAPASSVPFRWPRFDWGLIVQKPTLSSLLLHQVSLGKSSNWTMDALPRGVSRLTWYIRVVNRDRSRTTARPTGSQNYEQQTMTLGCELEINRRAESRFSPDDITRFGDSNDITAIAQFSSRVCSYSDNFIQRHEKAVRMRVKGNPRYGSGFSLSLWTTQRDGNIP